MYVAIGTFIHVEKSQRIYENNAFAIEEGLPKTGKGVHQKVWLSKKALSDS